MKTLEDLKRMRDEALKKMNMRYPKDGFRIQIGMGTCGIASGARMILDAFLTETSAKDLQHVVITQVGCMGECAYEPMAEIIDDKLQSYIYCNLTPQLVKEIVENHLVQNKPMERLLLTTRKG